MRAFGWLALAILAAGAAPPLHAQTSDSSLIIYAATVIKTRPFEKPGTAGYAIYLGRGAVITAAHVIGHWPFFTHPHVLIGAQDLPVTIVKEGSFEGTDLALLSIDEEALPVAVRLRRNPLCKDTPRPGREVISVTPDQTTRLHVVSPAVIAPELRNKLGTLVDAPRRSGSGLFDAERKCLVGVVSAKIRRYHYQPLKGPSAADDAAYVGYFVPAPAIVGFLPVEFRR
jgi:hypothetical protein